MITSAWHRFLKLGGLMGRVGASVVGSRVLELSEGDTEGDTRRRENVVRNAMRVVDTLGEMKGAAMKVGQMLSLHEELFPPEAIEVLRLLQKQTPRVPPEVMLYELQGALKQDYDRLFESFDQDAFAAASIGQVHRAKLRDGRDVAVKIQYPGIDRIIRADLANLRTLLHGLFSLFSELDFDPIWIEVRDRLIEELDYDREAENSRRMAEAFAGDPRIVIPAVVEEASTTNVLTMEFVPGISAEEACSTRHDAESRNRWGVALFELVLEGLMGHGWLHADPNLANFAFREDGGLVVYDFGCVKRIPPQLSAGYAALAVAAIEGPRERIPTIIGEMGVSRADGNALPDALIDPYFDLFGEVFREAPPYTFGEDEGMMRRAFDLGVENLPQANDLRFPSDLVFINRTLGGHFGNLGRLRASGPWRELVLRHAGRRVAAR